MKKLIFRKFTKDTLVFFTTSILIMGIIVWTLQAVNYFDFVTQDGHGLEVYFFYTILNFPKIIHIKRKGKPRQDWLNETMKLAFEHLKQNDKDFKFTEEVDRIYKNAPSSVKIRIENENDVTVQVSSSLSDGKDSNHDIVLWNPHIAKSKRMSDFGDDEWK